MSIMAIRKLFISFLIFSVVSSRRTTDTLANVIEQVESEEDVASGADAKPMMKKVQEGIAAASQSLQAAWESQVQKFRTFNDQWAKSQVVSTKDTFFKDWLTDMDDANISKFTRLDGKKTITVHRLMPLNHISCHLREVEVTKVLGLEKAEILNLANEIRMHHNLKHPNIVQMYDWLTCPTMLTPTGTIQNQPGCDKPHELNPRTQRIEILREASLGAQMHKAFNKTVGKLRNQPQAKSVPGPGNPSFVSRIPLIGKHLTQAQDYLSKRSREQKEEFLLRMIVLDLLAGLKFMHSQNVIHTNIEPDKLFAADPPEICFDIGVCRYMIGDLSNAKAIDSPDLDATIYNTKDDVQSLGIAIAYLFADEEIDSSSFRLIKASRYSAAKDTGKILSHVRKNTLIARSLVLVLESMINGLKTAEEAYTEAYNTLNAFQKAWYDAKSAHKRVILCLQGMYTDDDIAKLPTSESESFK